MGEIKAEAKKPDGKEVVEVRQAAGEGLDQAQLKAGSELQEAKDEALRAGYQARHAGNRLNWSE